MRLTEGIGPLMYAFDRRNQLLECMRLTVDNSLESQGFVENTPPPGLSSSSRAVERPYRRGKGDRVAAIATHRAASRRTRGADGYSTRRSGDGGIRGSEGESSNTPFAVE